MTESTAMFLKNHEGIEQFYIDPYWYKNRQPGVSALLRVKDEEEYIEPCLMSIRDFFDEIVITLNNCTDATPRIIADLNLPTVRVFEYPYQLHHNGPGHDDIPENSIHDNAFYYNWTLSKSTCQHVCKWDGDMVALPVLNQEFKKKVLQNNIVVVTGTNLAGEALAHQSQGPPMKRDPRFFKICKDTYYRQGSLSQKITYPYADNIHICEEPVFLHFKNAKSLASATKIWPENWPEMEVFQQLHERRQPGEPYSGIYPAVLKKKIIDRALGYAKKVEDLRWQAEVMNSMGDLLFELRNKGLQGSVVEIGSHKGKTTVFLSRLMETLFPAGRLISVDPYTETGVEKSMHLQHTAEIHDIYAYFQEVIGTLQNHSHLKMTSSEARERLPDDIICSFIDGEHTFNGVKNDFDMLYAKTLPQGIIVVDDYANAGWPEVGRAFQMIKKKYRRRAELVKTDSKAAYFMKKGSVGERIKTYFFRQ